MTVFLHTYFAVSTFQGTFVSLNLLNINEVICSQCA